MNIKPMSITPTSLVRNGIILFIANVALAYAMYPHWLTLSHFAEHWYTFILFAFAMLIAIIELWYLGGKLQPVHSRVGGYALRASAVCAALVVCIPYTGTGGATQRSIHNTAALLFVLLAALGFASIARQLRNYSLGTISGTLVTICALELILLARYNAHPIYPWVWVVLQLAAIFLLVGGLYIVAVILERKAKTL